MDSPGQGTVGQCIYCGSRRELADEHIVPFGLGGRWTLKKASCPSCSRTTAGFEREVQRGMFGELRAALKTPTRRRAERPTKSILGLERAGSIEFVEVPIEQAVQLLVLPVYPPPGFFRQGRTDEDLSATGVEITPLRVGPAKELALARGAEALHRAFTFKPRAFGLLLAKIAHCAAVDVCGLEGFSELYLPGPILRQAQGLGYWLGTGKVNLPPREDDYDVRVMADERGLVVALIDLFARIGGTTYVAVVGRLGTPEA